MTDSVKVSEEARTLDELLDSFDNACVWSAGAIDRENARSGYSWYGCAKEDIQKHVASLEADKRRLDWLDAQRESVFGTSPDGGEQIPVGEAWGVYGVGRSVREAIDAALTTQRAGEE